VPAGENPESYLAQVRAQRHSKTLTNKKGENAKKIDPKESVRGLNQKEMGKCLRGCTIRDERMEDGGQVLSPFCEKTSQNVAKERKSRAKKERHASQGERRRAANRIS